MPFFQMKLIVRKAMQSLQGNKVRGGSEGEDNQVVATVGAK